MAYQALYRKLRPTAFDGVVGQTAIVRALQNQIIAGRVSHAYLFCGTRGTGKTTAAKIFARAINCAAPQNGSPCNACPSCLSILADASANVIEMDAASNNGVDNIRDIREETRYAPAEGRYKAYIIDEAHMLSNAAFNALLKTLEEPPPFVVFILATTDPQKLPATILSRVQRFDFTRVPMRDMSAALRGYMAEERIDIDEEALLYVCRAADGAMRDALSILDQAASYYYGEPITLPKLLDALGAVDSSIFFDLTDAISRKDGAACLAVIDAAAAGGREFARCVTDLISHLRDLLVAGVAAQSAALSSLPEAHKAKLSAQTKQAGAPNIMRYIDRFSALSATLRHSTDPRVAFEVTCLSLCLEDERPDVSPAVAKPRRGGNVPPAELERPAASQKAAPAKAVPEDVRRVAAEWQSFAAALPMPLSGYAKTASVGYMEDERLYIVCESPGSASLLRKDDNLSALRDKLAERYQKSFDLNIVTKALYNAQHQSKYGAADAFDYSAQIAEIDSALGGVTVSDD